MRNHCIRAIIQWSKNKKDTSKADSHDLTTVKSMKGEVIVILLHKMYHRELYSWAFLCKGSADLSSKAFPEL